MDKLNSKSLLAINFPGRKLNTNLLAVQLMGNDYLSSPFSFVMTVLADACLPLSQLLKQSITLTINNWDGEATYYNGILYQAYYEGVKAGMSKNWYQYKLVICPKLVLLAEEKSNEVHHVAQSNIEGKSIPDIVKEILNEVDISCTPKFEKAYNPVSFSVRYNESKLEFIHRLLCEAGIYYYFEHTDAEHTLVLSDYTTPSVKSICSAVLREDTLLNPRLDGWQRYVSPFSNNMRVQRYDFTLADRETQLVDSSLTETSNPSDPAPEVLNHFKAPQPEYFHDEDMPVDIKTSEDMKKFDQQKWAGMQLAATSSVIVDGNYRDWQAGTQFKLSGQSSYTSAKPGKYYVYAISHCAHDYSQLPFASELVHHKEADIFQETKAVCAYRNRSFVYSSEKAFLPAARYQVQDKDKALSGLLSSAAGVKASKFVSNIHDKVEA